MSRRKTKQIGPRYHFSVNLRFVSCLLTVLFCSLAQAQTQRSGSVALQRLSLPTGPGSIEGLGESFEPDLSTGSARYSVQFDIPQAAGGFAPTLNLAYDSNLGVGPFGIGWSLSLASIQRQTDKGIPSYTASDTFISSGEDLVELTNGSFLGENSKDYSRFRRSDDGWEKTLPTGVKLFFGESSNSREAKSGKDDFDRTFRWMMSSSVDLHGNRIDYHYEEFPGSDGIKYLSQIRYGFQGSASKNYHEVLFQYEESLAPPISYASRFRRKTGHRCREVVVNTVVNEVSTNVRKYVIHYRDSIRVPLIETVTQFDANGNKLPPLGFSYLSSQLSIPSDDELAFTNVKIGIPAQLRQEDIALCDLNQDGLNDICYSVPDKHWQYLLNRGNLGFSGSRNFAGIPTSLSLRDAKTQLVDITGDGRVDLVTTVPNDDGDQRVAFYEIAKGLPNESGIRNAAIDPSAKQDFANTCSIDLTTNGVRLFDLDFNKCVDFARILDDSLLVATNKSAPDGTRQWKQDKVFYSESDFPSDTVSPTMRLADVNGDRLMDFVDMFERDGTIKITCYYGTGDGHFASGQLLTFLVGNQVLETGEYPTSNLSTFHFADINADGLSDLVHVIPGNVRVWTSQGEFFEEPIDWVGPSYRTSTQILLLDMNGNGSSDVIWLEPEAEDENQLKVLDCFPSGRGNLLSGISNGIGKRVDISYRPITDYYLASIALDHPWESVSPIPLHVVSRVSRSNSLDLDQDGNPDSEVSSLIYRDPYYDGREKQFRGFAQVTRIDWGDDLDVATAGPATTVTRHRFHTGAPDGIDNDGNGEVDEFNHVAGSEEEPLKGRLLWEETCGIDAVDLNEDFTAVWPKKTDASDGFDIDGDGEVDFALNEQFTHDTLVYRRKLYDWRSRSLYNAGSAPALNNHTTKLPFRIVRDAQLKTENVQHIEGPYVATLAVEERAKFKPRVVKSSFDFNSFGGMTQRTEFGVVAPDEVKDSARTHVIEYAHQGTAIDNWLLDRVARTTVRDSDGKVVSGERTYYGDLSDDFTVLPLFQLGTRALKIKTDGLLIPNSQAGIDVDQLDDDDKWVQRSIEGFDKFGNVTWMLDGEANVAAPANGHSRQLTYDPIFSAFPVSETIHVAPGKQLRAKAAFDIAFGTMTELVDFNEDDDVTIQDRVAGEPVGDVRTVKGKRTTLKYDSHARLSALIRPGDSLDFPTEKYNYIPADPEKNLQYFYDENGDLDLQTIAGDEWKVALGTGNGEVKLASGLSAVVTLKREKAGQDGTVGTVALTDGMGRSIAKASENANPQSLFLESVLLDSRGNADQILQPHENISWTPASTTRRQRIKRDPMGRVFSTAHPKDSTDFIASSRTVFLPLTERRYDEEDNRVGSKHKDTFTDIVSDGFERLIKVNEHVRLSDDGETVADVQIWPTVYSYDLLDNLVKITDAQKNITHHRYDSLGRRRAINDPDRGKSSFDYDLTDNEVHRKDARGAIIVTTYDGANRKLTETGTLAGNTQTVSFHYDVPKPGITDGTGNAPTNCLGRLAWVEDLAGQEHHSYSSRGLIHWTLRRFNAGDAAQRDYLRFEKFDSQDRRFEQKLISHGNDQTTIVSDFNNRGLVKDYKVGGTVMSSFRYHPNGVVSQTDYHNTTKTVAQLDHRLRLRSLAITKPVGGVPQHLIHNQYTYDNVSNLLRIDDLRPAAVVPFNDPRRNTQAFALDDAYRLRTAAYFTQDAGNPATTSVTFKFDRIGNQLEKTAAGTLSDDDYWKRGLGTTAYSGRVNRDGATTGQPGPHAAVSSTDGMALLYDASGSAKKYDGKDLIRDAWGRISKVVSAGTKLAEYRYGHSGDRLLKITDDDSVFYPFAEARDSKTNGLRHYLTHDNKRLICFTGDNRFFLHQDHIGSLILTTNAAASAVEELTYMPYGTLRSYKADVAATFTSHYRFGGNERDAESGLYFFQNRYLVSGIGNFASCDPVLHHAKSKLLRTPISVHAYAYSLRNPFRYVDPDGRLPIDTIWDAGCVIYDLGKMVWAVATDNPKMMSEAKTDTLMDLGAMVIPYAPAGITKIARGAGKGLDAAASGPGRNVLQDLFSIKAQKGLGDIAAGTRAEAEAIGKAWVNGANVKSFPLKSGGYGVTDGTRTFRMQFKQKSKQWKANFQENVFIKGQSKGVETKNIHMDITDIPSP